ncbi:Endonuclease V-like [Methanonatronarchaeum thermophilum]|uniref:UPF0215 protein AMET1_1064 n=1 Tax=Methanonatronarchaeum thermophilum TaxID=1927129 RepID=A0A1Y3G9P7_9EURY|nr:endonuclease V [Methanonatronarchaeum thermophilum]OUJ18161.1 Endonuclease V-like [Methanonatronarchaeum thermophilum]
MKIKEEIRVLGVDDGPYQKNKNQNQNQNQNQKTIVVGTVYRGGSWIDGVTRTDIKIDGLDATNKIGQMTVNSKHHNQIRAIFLDGITYGGMNTVNIEKLYKQTDKPVIAVSRQKPNFKQIKKAIQNLPNPKKRWKHVKNAGKPIQVNTTPNPKEKPIYIQPKGIDKKSAIELTKHTSTRSRIPEPIRVAHLIATGITTGDSHGGA